MLYRYFAAISPLFVVAGRGNPSIPAKLPQFMCIARAGS